MTTKDFSKVYVSGEGLPQYINQLGEGTVGLELGVWTGENFANILQQCPGIKTLYGMDPYAPYQDWNRMITQEIIDDVKRQSMENIHLSGHEDKVQFFFNTAAEGLDLIPDGSLDFIFVDGDHSYENAKHDITNYYSKVRSGGLYAGHDFSLPGVTQALKEFIKEANIDPKSLMFTANDVWLWFKP